MKLKEKVALITGGGSGLGRAIAEAYVREGASVAICGRNKSKLDETVDGIKRFDPESNVLAIQTDVSSSGQVKDMFQQILQRFNTLDILVNNAGVFRSDPRGAEERRRHLDLITKPGPRHSLGITQNITDEEWDMMFRINVDGTFYCLREALKIMEEKQYGRIINIASISGISSRSSHSPNYSAAKGAVVALTRSVGHEVAGANICVNCIAPGYIATEEFTDVIDRMDEDQKQRLMMLIPKGRLGELDEYVPLAVFLASDDASYMVGQVISPNGGIVIEF